MNAKWDDGENVLEKGQFSYSVKNFHHNSSETEFTFSELKLVSSKWRENAIEQKFSSDRPKKWWF